MFVGRVKARKEKEQSEGIAETSSRRDRKRMQFFYAKKRTVQLLVGRVKDPCRVSQ